MFRDFSLSLAKQWFSQYAKNFLTSHKFNLSDAKTRWFLQQDLGDAFGRYCPYFNDD
jgi:hypothetical protein